MPEQTSHDTSPNRGEANQPTGLEYFIEEVGAAASFGELSRDELRAITETAIWLKFGYEAPDDSPRDIKGELEKTLTKENKPLFTPRSRSETQTIITKPERRLGRAAGRPKHGAINIKAAKPTYLQMDGHRLEAKAEMEIFNQVMVSDRNGEDVPDPEALQGSEAALDLLAAHLMRRQFLAENSWPAKNTRKYKDLKRYCRGAIDAAAIWGSDDFLRELIELERADTRARLGYWAENVDKVARTTAGLAVKSALIGPENPGADKIEEPEIAEEPAVAPAVIPEESSFDMPPEIRRSQLAKYAPQTARIRNQVQQGVSPMAAGMKEFGGGEPILDEEGSVLSYYPPDKQPSTEALVESEIKRKERRKRRFGKRR